MLYLLIGLVLVLAIGPVLWLLPSRQALGASRLRLAARRYGLGVEMVQPAWPSWLSPLPPRQCAQYYLPRPGHQQQWCFWQFAPGLWVDHLRDPCRDPQLAVALAKLPADAYQIEAKNQMLLLCWGEQGDAECLAVIKATLQSLP